MWSERSENEQERTETLVIGGMNMRYDTVEAKTALSFHCERVNPVCQAS